MTVEGLLPEGTELTALDVTPATLFADESAPQTVFAYDITLLVDGEPYQPEQPVTVTVAPAVPVTLSAGQTLYVEHIHDDGESEELPAVLNADGTVSFEASSFSVYIGTVVTSTAVVLFPGVGYNFYSGSTAYSGKEIVWSSSLQIIVRPDAGYKIDSVSVQGASGEDSDTAVITANSDGSYTVTFPTEPSENQLLQVTASKDPESGETIYFDLSAGMITIAGNSYTGYRYDGSSTASKITGTLQTGQNYYVYQSDGDVNTGFVNGSSSVTLPVHTRVTHNGEDWADYVADNSDVNDVIRAWNTSAPAAGRKSTPNYIKITGKVTSTMTIDSLWSSHHESGVSKTTGGIGYIPGAVKGAELCLYFKGDNRFGNIYYACDSPTDKNKAVIPDNLLVFDGDADSTLTVANFTPNGNTNYWCAAIGANDSADHVKGLVFNGGNIFAGTTVEDDCSAIGGGGNGYGHVTINGGTITAVCSSSGAAIGGGIGKSSQGGSALVTIKGGLIYAYNFSCESRGFTNHGVKYIPAAAIGGGSSGKSAGNSFTQVIISGGEVHAQSVGGTAIGGGSSADVNGGGAIVDISGGVIYAKSISGTIGGTEVPAGAAIGGGTGGKTGNGGNATVRVSGGTLYTGSIGGGATINPTGKAGNATVLIEGGEVYGQVIMGEVGDGVTACRFTMTGGELSKSPAEYEYKYSDGGAVYMDDPIGVVNISGGEITGCSAERGGAVYMTAGDFTLTGKGSITNCSSEANGGAIYLGGGKVTVSGGSITNCSSEASGGAIYLADGTVNISGGSISKNTAAVDGGGACLGGGTLNVDGGSITENTAQENGGGAYVQNGNVFMGGGKVDSNKAVTGAGGGMFVSAENAPVIVDILSGSVSGNSAGTGGGALAVVGNDLSPQPINVTVGVSSNLHFDAAGELCVFDHENAHNGVTYTHASCPVVSNNLSQTDGGAIYISGSTNEGTVTALDILCVTAMNNQVGNDGLKTKSDFMKIEGGKIVISSAEFRPEGVSDPDDYFHGLSMIGDSLHVVAGQVDLYGNMTNPSFGESITVAVPEIGENYFRDHRYAEDTGHYKILYFANYYDTALGQASVEFTEFQVEEDSTHVIIPALYERAGHRILGWDTEPDGSGVRFEVSTGYIINDELDGMDADENQLTLYAIWQLYGYNVAFEPNVPLGVNYGVKMPNKFYSYEQTEALPANTYVRSGYRFTGWNTAADGSGIAYQDEQVVGQLTNEEGATVKLYAQWALCTHDPALGNCKYTYTTEDDGATLVRNCSCGSQTLRYKIIAQDAVYDRTEHTASAQIDSGWTNPPELQYVIDFREEEGTYEPFYDVGYYVASVTAGGVTASKSYEILMAKQDAPASVTFTANGGTLTVTVPPSPNLTKTSYRLVYFNGPENKVELDWQESNSFTLPANYTSYQVYARYEKDHNYLTSPATMSEDIYFYGDSKSAIITITADEGIDYTAMGDAENSGFRINVAAENGFYLTEDFAVTHQLIEGTATDLTITPTTPRESYLMTGIPATCRIHIHLSGAKPTAKAEAAVAPGQVFGTVSGSSADITRDSAFTAYYEVEAFDAAAYSDLLVSFTSDGDPVNVPAGTSIILLDKLSGGYWSYTADAAVSELSLGEFERMGAPGTHYVLDGDLYELQFVVDFSRTANGFAGDALTMSLGGKHTGALTPALSASVDVSFGGVSFSLANQNAGEGLTQQLRYTFSADGAASKWANRSAALVLAPADDTLPADATMTLETAHGTAQYLANADGAFILPLLAVDSGTASITLRSTLFPSASVTYSFTVQLLVSNTSEGGAPMNGQDDTQTDPVTVVFTKAADAVPSMKIEGEQLTKADLLAVVITSQDIPAGAKIMAYVQQKTANGYRDTAQSKQISANNADTPLISLGAYENDPGSYRLVVETEYNGHIIMSVPHYFIIH